MFEQIYKGEGSLRVCLEVHVSTNGAILYLSGGDLPHIGGVAVGVPRPRDATRLTANVSVISIYGHKDDELARLIADKVARRTGKLAVVVAGIHVDNATSEDIQSIVQNAQAAVDMWVDRLKAPSQGQ